MASKKAVRKKSARFHVRNPRMEFPSEDIPRSWFGGSQLASHIANGVNLLFPAGERFFIRSVRHYLDQVKDPVLREQAKAFFGQEGQHAKATEDFIRLLEKQGYDVRSFLKLYERIAYGMIEPAAPPVIRLAATAALEHFTAILAEDALTAGDLDHAHPKIAELFRWHAAEEIEHKAVAYDVLQEVNPSYAVRVAGLLVGASCLGGFWFLATLSLISQEKGMSWAELLWELQEVRRTRSLGKNVFLKGLREYLRRDFHPADRANEHLAREYLASVGFIEPAALAAGH